jgi:hypothetical protein
LLCQFVSFGHISAIFIFHFIWELFLLVSLLDMNFSCKYPFFSFYLHRSSVYFLWLEFQRFSRVKNLLCILSRCKYLLGICRSRLQNDDLLWFYSLHFLITLCFIFLPIICLYMQISLLDRWIVSFLRPNLNFYLINIFLPFHMIINKFF